MSISDRLGEAAQTPHRQDRSLSRRRFLQTSVMFGVGLGLSPTLARADAGDGTLPVREHMVDAGYGQFHVIEQGAGPAVLFVHGFPDTAETWRSQMQAVAEAGYRAVALDMRGYGQSFAPESADLYTALHLTGDLIAVLDALSIETAVLVGHDWGAYQSQMAALLRPDRFRALVSLAIPIVPRGEFNLNEILLEQGLGDAYYVFEMAKEGSEARFADAETSMPSILYWLSASPAPADRWDPINPALNMLRPAPVTVPAWADAGYVRHTIDAFQRTGFRGGMNYYRAFPKTFELMVAYKDEAIQQPSLYIWGAADGLSGLYHPEPITLASLREVQPNLVDQIRLENTGHWIQHEVADRVNDELVGFLVNL
jgi:pimeloyl-ACP methyl ester carboxylesterase